MDNLSAEDTERLLQTAIQCCPCFKRLYNGAVEQAEGRSPPRFDYELEKTRYNFIIDPFQHLRKGQIPKFIDLIDQFTIQVINKIQQSVNQSSPKEIVKEAFDTLVSCFQRSMELFAGCYEAKCIELKEDSHIIVAQKAVVYVGGLYLKDKEGMFVDPELERAYKQLSPVTISRWIDMGKEIAEVLQKEKSGRESFDG